MASKTTPSPVSKPGPRPTLDFFAVYSPELGPTEETELEQLLFFWPEEVSQDDKIKRIGLAQGLVNFTRTFSPAKPCQNAHSQKSRMTIMEVEPGFWMLLRIKLGVATMPGKDGKEVMEYLDTRLSDSTCEEMIREAYRLFKLLNSTLTQIVANFSAEELRRRLRYFFVPYMARWNAPNAISDLPVVRSWGGMDLLTLDRESYHEVLGFVYGVEDWRGEPAEGRQVIGSTVLLWRSQVIWNGLRNLDDLSAIYDLLTDPGIAQTVVTDIREPRTSRERGAVVSGRALGFAKDGTVISAGQQPVEEQEPVAKPGGMFSFGRRDRGMPAGTRLPFSGFLTGPLNLSDADAPIVLQHVWIDSEPDGFASSGVASKKSSTEAVSKLREHSLIVYQHMYEFTLLFFVPHDDEHARKRTQDLEFYNSLEAYMRPRLDRLLPIVKEEWKARKRGSEFIEEHYRYLYLNDMNLAIRSSLGTGKPTRVTEEMLRCLQDLRPELRKDGTAKDFTIRYSTSAAAPVGPPGGSSTGKPQEFWVVARYRDDRELYIILPGTKNSTLADVETEIKTLTASFFGEVLAS